MSGYGASLFTYLGGLCAPDSPLGGLVAGLGPAALPLGLLAAGIIGSTTHCTAMCGPFVLAQSSTRLAQDRATEFDRLARLQAAALLPYHLGRGTTYVGLGAIFGALSGAIVDSTGFHALLGAGTLAAAVIFLAQGLTGLGIRLPQMPLLPGTGFGLGWLRYVRPLLTQAGTLRGYILGLALGFLPCGFLYGALLAAAASGSGVRGALAMLAFVVGTMPSLIAVGYLGAFFGRARGPLARRLVALLMLGNALLLGVIGVQLAA